MIDTTIDDACCCLQRSVDQFIKKYQKRFQGSEEEMAKLRRHISKLVHHAQHILQTLTVKRTSLKHAVTALYECWEMAYKILQDSKASNLQSILQHILQCYLRLGDGMILLASGECRHPGDIQAVKYKSNLTMNQIRGDGYTMLYSKDLTYSGFGWDEFFDANCGVQARLVNALSKISGGSKSKIWDTLLDHGAESFEASLDTHETQLHLIRKSLDAFRERVKGDLVKLLPNRKVTFATQDKMEYLEVRGCFKLQRRANEFQVKGDEGALPTGWTATQWKAQLSLPSRIISQLSQVDSKKRQRVIADSDDDEDCGVYVLKTMAEEVVTTNMSSLKAIKSAFGVDATDLEIAREQLEAEIGEEDKPESTEPEDGSIKNRRTRVARLRKALSAAVDAKEDALEIWDVREHLRKETMQLGNDLLGLQGAYNLTEAKDCFAESMKLVDQQEAAHKLIVRDAGNNTEDARLIRRNLLLLKGRAQTNFGIALLELSLSVKAPSATKKKQRTEAASSLMLSRQCALQLQALATDDRKGGASTSEAAFGIIDAVQLEVLAWRSYGSVMWHDGKETDAVKAFENAATAHTKIKNWVMVYIDKGGDFLKQYLGILMECYFSATTLFDLAAAKFDRLSSAGSSLETSSSKPKCTSLLSVASNAAEQVKVIVSMMEQLTQERSGFAHFLDDNGVAREHDVDEALQGIKQRGIESVDGSSVSTKSLDLPKNQGSDWRRNHLGMGMLLTRDGNLTTRRFVITDSGTSRRSRNKRHCAADRDFPYAPPVHQEAASGPSLPTMKWGDDLLPQNETSTGGGFASRLQYPACAPPLPPELRSLRKDLM
ncbi:hypothetical protein MHU86_14253 [Fragilaria crotonensis]|nr:hypothetical protein MHU86_14253 [Fragilaria crotonensis]